MRAKTTFFSFLLVGSLLTGCNSDSSENQTREEPIAFEKEGELELLKPSGETIRQLDIEIADDAYERQTGLMYRESMENHQGMLFIFSNEAPRFFHMENTKIPLDIIFFSSDSIAISFQKNAQPLDETSLPSGEPAQFVLEINAGLVDEWNIEIGDKIQFERL